MSITVADLEHSDAAGLAKLAEQLRSFGDGVQDDASWARDTAEWGEIWTGSAADAASRAADTSSAPLEALGFTVSAAGEVTDAQASALGGARTTVQAAMTMARGLRFTVSPAGDVSAGALALLPTVGSSLAALAQTLGVILRAAITFITGLDAAAGAALRAMLSGAPPAPEPARDIPHEAVAGGDVPIAETAGANGPIVTVGDVEKADQIITLVSGVGSSEPGSTERTVAWARTQVEQAAAQGRSVAVVAWHDYKAPSNIAVGTLPFAAHTASGSLEKFQRGLRSAHPNAQLTVVGYSYGSVVTGTAAEQGLTADNIHFWGSPGTRVPSASELELHTREGTVPGDGRVETTLQPGDMISFTTGPFGGVHGPDPAAPNFSSSPQPGQGAPAEPQPGWDSYAWRKILDALVCFRGEGDAHSSYLADPQVSP